MKKVNKSRFVVALGTATIVIAPIATVVACDNNKPAPVKAVTNSKGEVYESKVDYTDKLSKRLNQLKEINTSAMNVGKIDKTAYSISTLSDEAKEIYGTNKAAVWLGWRSNPLNAAVHSVASLIRALANKYGYDVEVNGTSPKDEFLKNQYQAVIADDASIASTLKSDNTKNQAKFLSSIKQDLTKKTPQYIPFTIGETEEEIGWTMERVGIDQTGYPETHIGESVNDLLEIRNFAIWDDEKNPGQAIMGIYTNSGLYKEVQLKGIKDMYAVIEDQKFESEYVPYIKNVLISFVKLLKDNSSALSIFAIDPLLLNQVDFFIEKNTENGELKFDDDKLLTTLKELNNGSFNLLAIKALSKGFDKSMTSGFYSLLTNGAGAIKHIAYAQELKGIEEWKDIDFTQWLGWADSGSGWVDDGDGTQLFNAVDIIDETYLTNKVPVSTIASIKGYINIKENIKFDINEWVKDVALGTNAIDGNVFPLPFDADSITLSPQITTNVLNNMTNQNSIDSAKALVQSNIDKIELSKIKIDSEITLKDLAIVSYTNDWDNNDKDKLIIKSYEEDHTDLNGLPEFLKLPGAKMTVKSVDSANGSIVVTISCQTYSHDFTIDGYNKNS